MDYFVDISKKSQFSWFLLYIQAVTNIIQYVVWQLEHGEIISF